MAVSRRRFVHLAGLLAACPALAASAWTAARRRLFPGRVVKLDPDSIRRPGPWAG